MGCRLIGDFTKALAQMLDRRFRRVLLRSIALTVLLLVAFVWGSMKVLDLLLPMQFALPFIGAVSVPEISGWIAGGILTLLSLFAIIPVSMVVIGAFLEQIADAVEAKHYPDLPKARDVPTSEIAWEVVRFILLIVVVNALALVIYLSVAVAAPFVFWIVNGLLLGREYFQLVAIRRLPRPQADALRRSNRIGNWITGTLLAIPLSIPVLGLLVPIFGVAVFTHRFHRLAGRT